MITYPYEILCQRRCTSQTNKKFQDTFEGVLGEYSDNTLKLNYEIKIQFLFRLPEIELYKYKLAATYLYSSLINFIRGVIYAITIRSAMKRADQQFHLL